MKNTPEQDLKDKAMIAEYLKSHKVTKCVNAGAISIRRDFKRPLSKYTKEML